MSTRSDRYYAAVCLAQMILEEEPGDDLRLIAEAISALTGEVLAGRRNQVEFPAVAAELFERLMSDPLPRLRLVVEHE